MPTPSSVLFAVSSLGSSVSFAPLRPTDNFIAGLLPMPHPTTNVTLRALTSLAQLLSFVAPFVWKEAADSVVARGGVAAKLLLCSSSRMRWKADISEGIG
ncbi:unnamed protein product [Linum trigynum]|uniref:Secreted protein n=1 Tax=Linum trigynum TaxID=586398 RepID=A0AAV2FZ44_9ROSI